jgi:hypothetical protein
MVLSIKDYLLKVPVHHVRGREGLLVNLSVGCVFERDEEIPTDRVINQRPTTTDR